MKEIINIEFSHVLDLIQKARHDALSSVNKELINLYWNIGEYISIKVDSSEWGDKTIEQLALFIKSNYQDIKGFSKRNLYWMKQFFEVYKDFEFVYSLRTQLNWTHHRIILTKTKSIEEKEFYIRLAIKEHYSTRELERQIDSAYFERTMMSPALGDAKTSKLSTVVTELNEGINSYFKNTYVFEFLNLPEPYSENELQKGLVANLKKFILELGKDFAFVGEYYRVQAGGYDYYIDLLFFHRELLSLVAIELKIDDFKPEYMGKMEFYLEALDREHKKPNENPSIGIILCKSKDEEVVEIAMSRSLSPALVAEYETKLIDKKLLKEKLHELYEIYENDIRE